MLEFLLVNLKTGLVENVSDSVPYLSSEQHHVARHEVEHNVIKHGLQRLGVYFVEVNVLVSYYLHSDVPFDERNAPS